MARKLAALLSFCLGLLFLPSCAPVPVFDPNIAAINAENQAQAYSAMATGSAQAPIIAITQTSAAITQSAALAQATSAAGQQTQVAAVTQTAIFYTPTPIPTSTPNATATVAAQAFAVKIKQDERAEKRAELTNNILAVVPYLVGLFFLVISGSFAFVYFKRLALVPVRVADNGRLIPVHDVIQGTWTDIESSANGQGSTSRKAIALLPEVTAERQERAKEHSQMVDLQSRIARLPKSLPRRIDPPPSAAMQIPAPAGNEFLLPSWDMIKQWDGKGGIPYITAQGLKLIDVNAYPHLSVLGMTGMGKSRRYIRPLIACALAMGDKVIVIGKSADYFPFENHPNVVLVKVSKFTEPDQAHKYAKVLETLVAEMNRRDDILSSAHASTWLHAGHARTWIILDELGNALRMMGDGASHARIQVEGLVNEGRKAGFNVVLANQRATGMSSILSQTGKAIFRVERDEEKAHKSLTGASSLAEGYYFARFGRTELAGAFEPTDSQLTEFLASHPVKKLEPENWIEGCVVEQKQIPSKPQPTLPTQTDEEIRLEDKIASAWMATRDSRKWGGWNDLERQVYGEVINGARQVKIKRIVAEVQGIEMTALQAEFERLGLGRPDTTPATTNATTTPETSQSGGFVAGITPVVAVAHSGA